LSDVTLVIKLIGSNHEKIPEEIEVDRLNIRDQRRANIKLLFEDGK
jgi:hypothetical protein